MSKLFFRDEKGQKHEIFNKRSKNMSGGGFIMPRKGMTIDQVQNDSLLAMLEPNSLVVPAKKNHLVYDYIRKHGYDSILGEKQKDKRKLAPVILMPNEFVIHKKHADKVERYLKRRGVSLPLKD